MQLNLRALLNAGLSFFYPEWCQVCDQARATPAEGYVCVACRSDVRMVPEPFCERCGRPLEGAAITTPFECSSCRDLKLDFDWARSAVLAKGVALEVIHRYKYHRALWCEPFLAGLLVQAAQPKLTPAEWDLVVPVPLYPAREREREFNQAERLAWHLSKATDIRLASRTLKRLIPTPSQTRLDRQARQDNVRNAFALRSGVRVSGKRIVLVDDVFTTGATTSACSRTLRRAGAARVCVWTVARGN